MNKKALNNINCGLFVLTTAQNNKQTGCIINTAMQDTSTPLHIVITVN